MSEAGSGSDVVSMKLRADKTGIYKYMYPYFYVHNITFSPHFKILFVIIN